MPVSRPTRLSIGAILALERLNKEVKRRADVVGIFPNEVSIMRLIGAALLQIEGMAELTPLLIDADPVNLPPWRPDQWPAQRIYTTLTDVTRY